METQELHIRDNNKEAWASFCFLDGNLEISIWSTKKDVQFDFHIDENTLNMLGYAYTEHLKKTNFVNNNTITVIPNKLDNG